MAGRGRHGPSRRRLSRRPKPRPHWRRDGPWLVRMDDDGGTAPRGAVAIVNNAYFAWLHRRAPGLFRPRVLLAIFGLCIVVIAIGMTLNPPSEMQKGFQRVSP